MAKRHSASSTLREMHIKVTVKYPVTPVRRATIKNKTKQNKKNSNQQMLARIWRKGNLHALPVGKQTEAASTENSIEAPQKITNGTTV